jgi:hypothetical protein
VVQLLAQEARDVLLAIFEIDRNSGAGGAAGEGSDRNPSGSGNPEGRPR